MKVKELQEALKGVDPELEVMTVQWKGDFYLAETGLASVYTRPHGSTEPYPNFAVGDKCFRIC